GTHELRLFAGLQPGRQESGVRLRRRHGSPVGHRAAEEALSGTARSRGAAAGGGAVGGTVVPGEEGPDRGRGRPAGRPIAGRAAAPRGPPRRPAPAGPLSRRQSITSASTSVPWPG